MCPFSASNKLQSFDFSGNFQSNKSEGMKVGSSYWSLYVQSHEAVWFFSFNNGLLSIAHKLDQMPSIYFLKGNNDRIIFVLCKEKWFYILVKQNDEVEN